MRKTTKGALAVGAGVALLLGGAGTMAAWQLTSTAATGTVSSGEFNLATTAGATWKWGTATSATGCTATTTDFPVGAKIVPGDCVIYTQPITVTASGNRLVATLSVSAIANSGVWSGLTATSATTMDANPAVTGAGSPFTITPGTGTVNATGKVVTTIVFDPATTSSTGQNSTATLNGVTLVLKQTAPTT
ncbi:alternate-type signal peptide domain-containing protein [Cellulomonas humilata]|uniref:Alternate-type signal peptide domain-containing protein n=1 Tax=Cellulomonas humilata TaxID=144055 RepID=A0A7Y6A2N5_9CELL|nr:alternate-type signal peptide domain-containing protein [Cellulomonas humilata]NUU17988.1 alternate-type signal peptide domain-containing protein [Cellulomonas humilata]